MVILICIKILYIYLHILIPMLRHVLWTAHAVKFKMKPRCVSVLPVLIPFCCFVEWPCHKLTRNVQAKILHQEKDRFN